MFITMTNSRGRTFAGFLAGAAAGAILGILFAPRRGAETRNQIRTRANEIGRDVSAKVGSKYEEMRGYVQNLSHDVKKKKNEVENLT
jgi:gas vesicle protein